VCGVVQSHACVEGKVGGCERTIIVVAAKGTKTVGGSDRRVAEDELLLLGSNRCGC
jgi:hypothetical protein